MGLNAVIAVFALALLASFLGAIHGLGDSLAVFRTGLAGALLLLSLFAGLSRVTRLVMIVWAVFGLGTVFWHKLPLQEPGPVVIYQKNMFHANDDLAGLAADILSVSPDFVTLQEVSLANEALLEALRMEYPHQLLCRYTSRSGIALLSRQPPLEAGKCSRNVALASAPFDLAGGTVFVHSLHIPWPFPGQQPRHMAQLVPLIEGIGEPVIIGGDFNMVPWSHGLRRVARASNTERAGPTRTSFLLGSLPIAIDHVFAPNGGRTEARPLLGGDHFGIVARVHLSNPEDRENQN
jgi:endonuclease/exonuclease/phosphatase (EEP) superfamily protein YafD